MAVTGNTLWELHQAGALDQVHAIVAPKLCGGREAKTPFAGRGVAEMADAVALHDTYSRELGECRLMGGFVDAS